MSTKILTFFNNKGGVGKTSLLYHLAWMFADLGKRVVCADLDPQSNLTAAFLTEEKLETLWQQENLEGTSIYQCVKPLTRTGDILPPKLQKITEKLYLLPGDVALSSYEDILSSQWPESMADNNLYRPMRILSSFWQVMQMAAKEVEADIILVDIGPNLGAINRSVLIATDYVVIPLGADLFSLQGLKNLGPTLQSWKNLWGKRLDNWTTQPENEQSGLALPSALMQAIGYLCQQHSVRLNRPVKAYDRWLKRIPNVYRECVLKDSSSWEGTPENDPYCLATIKHYRSLVAIGQEYRKPIFKLTIADGVAGSHANAVMAAHKDFEELARKIAQNIHMSL